jgi:tRNA 5-methylaminomethyl-2-thiouridine biosynthesis bifunctional protein
LGLGRNFLLTWQAWKIDPQRPLLLHFAAIDAVPASPAALVQAAAEHPDLLPLALQLSEQWQGLLPGFHRLSFEGGRVLLTLGIGDAQALLKEHCFEADSVYLDGLYRPHNPDFRDLCDLHLLKALTRCCRRGTRLASMADTIGLQNGLAQCGFEVIQVSATAAQSAHLRAHFNPRWKPKKATERPWPRPRSAARCVVIGAGLAGAACAASLARRGWQVTVLDAHNAAAGGASGLPVGLLAPHVSPDDSLLSRLSRHGLRATWQVAKTQLLADLDWQTSGVLQRRFDASGGLPKPWPEAGEHSSRRADADELRALRLATGLLRGSSQPNESPALWHAAGGWIKPQRLVQALLAATGISARYGVKVTGLSRATNAGRDCCWQVLDADHNSLAEAELVVMAAGFDSARLWPGESLPLQAIRGQVAWGAVTDASALPPFPVNGHGSFVPAFPNDDGRPSWLMGATFERDCNHAVIQEKDPQVIFERLQQLLPRTAEALTASFKEGRAQAWAGVRCVSPDRLPIVGLLNDSALPGLCVCTALGARGLSFAVLCGELLAAVLHAEPLPIEKSLAQSLLASRCAIAPLVQTHK